MVSEQLQSARPRLISFVYQHLIGTSNAYRQRLIWSYQVDPAGLSLVETKLKPNTESILEWQVEQNSVSGYDSSALFRSSCFRVTFP